MTIDANTIVKAKEDIEAMRDAENLAFTELLSIADRFEKLIGQVEALHDGSAAGEKHREESASAGT